MKLKAGLLVAKGVSDSFVKQALHCNSGRAYSLHNGAKAIMNFQLIFFCLLVVEIISIIQALVIRPQLHERGA